MSGLTGGAAVDGDHASISVALPVGVTSWTFQAWGVGSYGDETYGTGANPTDYGASVGSNLLWQGVGDDGNIYQASAEIAPVAATGGVDLDLSFIEGTPIGPVDLTQNWTLNGNVLSFVSVSPALPTSGLIDTDGNLNISSPAVTADATYTLTMEDQIGRQTSDTFTLEITAAGSAITIESVTVGAYASGLPITISTTQTPDDASTVYWVLVPTGDTAPSAAEVTAGQAAGGGAPLDSGSFTWTASPPAQAVTSGIDQNCDIYVVIDNGTASNVGSDTNFAVDSTAASLSAATGTQTGATTASWGVTSNEAAGTIYAGARPAASAALTAAQLIAGSGGAGVAWDSDASPTADSANGGTFAGLTASTDYQVDVVQVDAYGNTSSVVSSSTFTTAAGGTASLQWIDQGAGVAFTGYRENDTAHIFTIQTGGAGMVLVFPVTYDARAVKNAPIIKETDASGTSFSVMSDGTNTADYQVFNRCGIAGYSFVLASGTSMDVYVEFDALVSRFGLLVVRLDSGSIKTIDRVGYDTPPNTTDFVTTASVAANDITLAITQLRSSVLNGMTGLGTPESFSDAAGNVIGQYAIETQAGAGTETVTETYDDEGQMLLVNVG